jgi:hypothetical protein
MEPNSISELDQKLLIYAIDKLETRFNHPYDLVEFWTLYGPCNEEVPTPEVRKPWMGGLGLSRKGS